MKISASLGITIAALGIALASFSIAAHADCAYPKAPAAMPDGKTASEAEMVDAMQAFKAYNEEVNAFGACLEQETKDQGGRHGAADAAEDHADQEAQRRGRRAAVQGQGVQRAGARSSKPAAAEPLVQAAARRVAAGPSLVTHCNARRPDRRAFHFDGATP